MSASWSGHSDDVQQCDPDAPSPRAATPASPSPLALTLEAAREVEA